MRRFIALLAIFEAAIFVAAGLYSWLIDLNYGTSLIWAGVAVQFAGSFASLGGVGAPRRFTLLYNKAFPGSNGEPVPKKWNEIHRSYDLCLFIGAAGSLLIGAGILVKFIWR